MRVPARLPDTWPATERFAAHRDHQRRAREVRVRLFRAIWLGDMDVSTSARLDAMGIVGPGAPRVARQWQRDWEEFDDATVPMVVTAAGEVHPGLPALDLLLSLRA